MLYSTYLAQQQAVSDERNSKLRGQVKVKSSLTPSGYMWMPQGMLDGTDHTKYYNAAQVWRDSGYQGKYTPPDLSKGETKGKIGYGGNSSSKKADSQPNAWSQPAANSYTAKSTIKDPRYIQDSTTQDAINNTMAQGYSNADERFQVKNIDRAGFSRGAGQNFMAAQEGVQQMQKAAQSAAEVGAIDQQQNNQMRSDYEKATEMEAQNNVMIQNNLSQSNWAKQFAEQSLNAQLEMAQMQAALQLRLALMR